MLSGGFVFHFPATNSTYGLDAVFGSDPGAAVQSAFWLEYHRLCDDLGARFGEHAPEFIEEALPQVGIETTKLRLVNEILIPS